MFFIEKLLIDGSLKDAWRIAHRDNTLEADGEVALPEMCEQVQSRINNDYTDRHRCLSLRSAGFLTSGLSRLYRRKVQKTYEDLFQLNTDISPTSDESEDENEENRIKRETSLLSLRKRRRPTTSDERETIRFYMTDEDRSSHSSPKIKSRGSLSNHNDKSTSNGDEENFDDDEEVVDDEFAPSDRNVADNSNESSSIRSDISEKSILLMTNKTVPKNLSEQNNAELKCTENGSHVDDKRVEGADSRNVSPMVIDDVVQSTAIRDNHEEVSGCKQSTHGHDVSVARTYNDQPTATAQEKQKSQTTQTILSYLNRPRGEIFEDSEGVNFRTDLPFGCLHVYDTCYSKVPTKIILTSLNENIRKLK